jgi:hypothetical protein
MPPAAPTSTSDPPVHRLLPGLRRVAPPRVRGVGIAGSSSPVCIVADALAYSGGRPTWRAPMDAVFLPARGARSSSSPSGSSRCCRISPATWCSTAPRSRGTYILAGRDRDGPLDGLLPRLLPQHRRGPRQHLPSLSWNPPASTCSSATAIGPVLAAPAGRRRRRKHRHSPRSRC